jgi:hypothetical protein
MRVSLDTKELDALADYLDNYAKTFEQKVQTFLERLAEKGIEVASVNGGDFSSYIVYSKKVESGTMVKMIAKDREEITNSWYSSSTSKELRQETISPLLMAEFGSGHYAISAEGEASGLGGQGTLNKYGHAFDSNGWYWWSDDATSMDGEPLNEKDGRWRFHSRGTHPSQPLHKAVMACIEQVEGIAREVFG